MKYRIFSLLILSYHTMTFSQESLKFDIGNSSSSVSDFSIEFEKRDYKGTVKFNQLKSTLRDIDFSFGKDYLKNSYASEARTVISNINNASKMYYQTRGEWPTETDQLEQAGQLNVSRSTKLKWTFDIQLSDQGGRITATSTEEMSGGAGHQIVYDADMGKFGGYGSSDDRYENEYFKFLLGVISANAVGINISIQEDINDFYIDIGKFSYSMNDWDIDIAQRDMIRQMIMSAKIEIQNLKILVPRRILNELNEEQVKYFRYFSENNGEIIVKKLSIDFTLDSDRYFDIRGILDLPIGKAKLSAIMSMGRDFNENPFFKNLQIDFTSLSPLGKSLMDNLNNASEIPLEKRGVGYTLQMAGFLNDRHAISLIKAEDAAEDAVISSIRAGLENYATEKLMENGRRSWPTNPWDALETKPAGYATTDANAALDGQWRFNTRTENITHIRADNTIWHWDYDKGTHSGFNSDIGSFGSRQEGVGD